MEFKETKKFTEIITSLLTDNEYRELQEYLINNPKAGTVIQNTGGLRKLRWALSGKGKSGGIRTLYYYADISSIIFMIYAYSKSEMENITDKEALIFKKLIDVIKQELK